MKRTELKKKSSLTEKLLRLLKPNSGLQESISLQEDNVSITTNSYHDYQKEIKTAMLEAERKKAEALMEWQKLRFIS